MKNFNKLLILLASSFVTINCPAISGTFYNSITNQTNTAFWSGISYEIGTDRWDNCGWWSENGWGYYNTGGNCSGGIGRGIAGYSTIGQTGGHTSNYGRTGAKEIIYITYPSGTNALTITNHVDGSDDEHIYLRTWCKNQQEWLDKEYIGHDATTFQKTIILPSATGGYDVAYALFEYSPQYGATQNEYVDFFESNKGTGDLIAARYVNGCF